MEAALKAQRLDPTQCKFVVSNWLALNQWYLALKDGSYKLTAEESKNLNAMLTRTGTAYERVTKSYPASRVAQDFVSRCLYGMGELEAIIEKKTNKAKGGN